MLRLLTLLLLTSPALAQLPPGRDGYAFPAGGKAGGVIEVTLGGSDWTPDTRFFCHDPRVKLEVLTKPGPVLVPNGPHWFGIKSFLNDPRLPREVTARFHIPAGFPVGPVRWSVANANGGGPGGLFLVGDGIEMTEDEKRTKPQELAALPVTVNGRLGRIEEEDRYQFRATANGLVTCDLFARRLGNDFNGVLEVRDGAKLVAEAVDTTGTDPVLTFAVEKGKGYTVTVRDVDHRGYRNFTYRLHVAPGPRLVTAVPPAGARGETRQIQFVGVGIATGKPVLETVMKDVAFPSVGDSFAYRLETPHGTTQSIALLLSDFAEQLEPATEVKPLPLPGAVSGRIGLRGERDTFTFTAKKGDVWDFAVQAERIGSAVYAHFAILSADGKKLAEKDGLATGGDPRLAFTVPTDGEYRLVVSDLSGSEPNLDSVYRLVARKPAGTFALKVVVPGIVNVPIGGKGALSVEVIRDGYAGPITLDVSGLPDGVTLPKDVTIPAGAASKALQLDCDKTAGVSASLVTVNGTAKIGDSPVTVTAEVVLPEDRVPNVLVATTLKPPFKVKSPEADGTRKVARGATHLADIVIERTDGFAGEILLDMAGAQQRHRQGIWGPAFPVPAGQSKVLYPVTLPEWLESTRTSRIGLVAMAKLPDPKGTLHWALTPMDGQVTMSVGGALMKLSPPTEEITATVGGTFEVPLRFYRVPHLKGAAAVTLVLPDELKGLLAAEPLAWAEGKPTVAFRVAAKDDPKLLGAKAVTVRATGTHEGYPVVSEAVIEIEFVRPKPAGR